MQMEVARLATLWHGEPGEQVNLSKFHCADPFYEEAATTFHPQPGSESEYSDQPPAILRDPLHIIAVAQQLGFAVRFLDTDLNDVRADRRGILEGVPFVILECRTEAGPCRGRTAPGDSSH